MGTGICWIISLVFALATAISLFVICFFATEDIASYMPFLNVLRVGGGIATLFFLLGLIFFFSD